MQPARLALPTPAAQHHGRTFFYSVILKAGISEPDPVSR